MLDFTVPAASRDWCCYEADNTCREAERRGGPELQREKLVRGDVVGGVDSGGGVDLSWKLEEIEKQWIVLTRDLLACKTF